MSSHPGDAKQSHELSVLVIGAGFAGVAVAVNLTRRGVHDFRVLEMGSGLGGTWWDNRYPGAECDVTSELYSFSFAPHVFTRTHASQPELQEYIEEVVEKHGLRDRFVLETKVQTVTWDDSEQLYTVTAADGRRWRARFVVSCVGQLNNPRYPDWPGMDEFQRPMFHTARWDHGVDLAGKHVAVAGTGSTSAQVVPEIAKVAGHVTLFQRQPGWVIPKPDRDYTALESRLLAASPLMVKARRYHAFVRLERMRAVAREGTRANRRMQKLAEDYLQTAVRDPELRVHLTPDYPYFGKRPVLTQYFYEALQRDNVTLVPHAVSRLTSTGVVDAEGHEIDIDVLVLATGFQPSRFLATYELTGRRGVAMPDVWGDAPKAFLGMMAEGFPNFFVTYGPNTNGGVVTFTLERQAEWISEAVALARRENAVLDIKPGAVRMVDRMIVERNNKFVWAKTGNNYYTSRTGRVVTQWPFSQKFYWLLVRLLRPGVVCDKSPLTAAGPKTTKRLAKTVTTANGAPRGTPELTKTGWSEVVGGSR